jgi:hypothetical protein
MQSAANLPSTFAQDRLVESVATMLVGDGAAGEVDAPCQVRIGSGVWAETVHVGLHRYAAVLRL